MQLHCQRSTSSTAKRANELTSSFIEQTSTLEGSHPTDRFKAIRETIFALNPFPHCSANGCICFGSRLQHEYQKVSPSKLIEARIEARIHADRYELHFPGVWLDVHPSPTEIFEQIATYARKRRNMVRDADGLIHEITKDLQGGTRSWIGAAEQSSLDTGQMTIYVVDCPNLHPIDSQALALELSRRYQGSAAEVHPQFLYQFNLQNIDHPISSSLLGMLTIRRRSEISGILWR